MKIELKKMEKKEFQRTGNVLAFWDRLSEPIVLMDLNGIIELWNQGAVKLLGFSQAETRGAQISEILILPGEKDFFRSLTEKAKNSDLGKGISCQAAVLNRDGHKVTLEFSMSGMEAGAGGKMVLLMKEVRNEETAATSPNIRSNIVNFQAANAILQKDIILRQNFQKDLFQSRERYRLLFESSSLASIFCDKKMNILECNRKALDLFKVNRKEEVLGENGLEFIKRFMKVADHKELNENYQRLLKTGSSSNAYKIKRKDGKKLFLQSYTSALYNEFNEIELFVIFFYDKTGEFEVTESLRESEKKFQKIFNSSPMAIFVSSLDSLMIDCNQTALDILGCADKRELMGKNCLEIFYPERKQKDKEEILVRSLKHDEKSQDFFLKNKAGDLVYLEGRTSVLVDSQGNPESILLIASDITLRRKMEKEQEQLLARLELKSTELESFVYTVTHDLKGPLISIDGFSSFLEKEFGGIIDDQGKHYLKRLRANISLMASIIDQLLELSRIGRVIGEREQVAAQDLIDAVLAEFSHQITEKKIKVREMADNRRFLCDRVRLIQVFANLLQNAIQFMGGQPNPLIEIGLVPANNDKYIQFFVRDNGIGIDEKYKEEIFQLFYRLNEIESRGTGIGLAIVKKIVEHHGGQIWVESEKGKGATFNFSICTERDLES